MDLAALKRIAISRWWILVLAVVLAVAISQRLTDYRNENLPQAEAITWVTFVEDPAAFQRDEFESLLETQFALAQTVNSDILNDTPGAFIPWPLAEIELELNQNQIQFVGRGDTEAEAIEVADTLRARFLAASSIGAGRDRIAAELGELTVQIGELRAKVATAQAAIPPTSIEIAREADRQTLQSQISALRGHFVQQPE